MIDFDKLKAAFPPDKISWRVDRVSNDGNKAVALAFIDARDVMHRLDEVCGPTGWQCRYSHADPSSVAYSESQKDKKGKPLVISKTVGKTVCDIGIYAANPDARPHFLEHGEWIWKADGAGDSDIEAEKGALSDAFKRAAVRWGIGRYLYDLPAPWVSIDQFKHILPSELERLAGMLPNAGPSIKVGMQGLSKEPAKFWSQTKLIVTLPAKFKLDADGNWPAEAWEWWKTQLKQGIDKAPSLDLLAKYQDDNQHILDQLPPAECHMLCEAFTIRAEQFDEQG